MQKRYYPLILLLILSLSCNLLNLEPRPEETLDTAREETPLPEPLAPPGTPPASEEDVDCDYFVSPDGNDSNPGTQTSPWGRFAYAAQQVSPGDTICFRGGTYRLEDGVNLAATGAPDNPITFISYPGEQPILDGIHAVGDLLTIGEGSTYLRLSGFTMKGFTSWGISLNGNNSHIQLDHLVVDGGEAGIHFTYGEDDMAPPEGGPVENITLEDSLILNSEFTAVDCTPGPCNQMTFRRLEVYGSGVGGEGSYGADGIAVSRGYPLLVEDCYIHDNGGDGIDLNSRDTSGYAQGVVVRRNQVVRNHQNGIKLWAGGRIDNNLVWGQGNSALWLGTFHSKLEVINNTVAYNMWDAAYSGRNWAFSAGYPEEIVALPQVELLLVNNIFAFNTGPQVGDPTGIYLGPGVSLTEHHNLYFSRSDGEISLASTERDFTRAEVADGAWAAALGQGLADLVVDPLFIEGWPQVNLHLQTGSPAIDAGDNSLCPAEDLLGNPRPADGDGDGDAACDIGVIEFNP